jgi:hypothetical protein
MGDLSTFLAERALCGLEVYLVCLLASAIYISQMKRAYRRGEITDLRLQGEIQGLKSGIDLLTWLVLVLDSLLVLVALSV